MNAENITGFKLEKSKNSQTITINYFVPELNRSRTDTIEDQPHIDLLNALKALSPYLAAVFHVDTDYVEIYDITGYRYNGDKIILTGKITTDTGSVVGIASPSIDTDGDSYGFEEALAKDIATLSLEVHHFLTGKKTGIKQLTIEDQTPDEEQVYSEEKFNKDLDEEESMDKDFVLNDNDE